MVLNKKISISLGLLLCGLQLFSQQPDSTNTDTTKNKGVFRKIGDYVDSLMDPRFRDSLLQKITRANESDTMEQKDPLVEKEQQFARHRGKVIRNIVFKKLSVFGPIDIYDTTFSTRERLIILANKVHFDTRQWAVKQALFFRQYDKINPYELADNERYLRSLPFIQDARIYVVNTRRSPDSVDVLVVTKDVFEYGARLSKLTTKEFRAQIYNNNVLGAGQEVLLGLQWNTDFIPVWNTEVRYTKFNAWGSFADVTAGYTALNNNYPLDTGVYETSYFISINRPLYRSSAHLAGGFMAAQSQSANVYNQSEDMYRNYQYRVMDVWAAYNFRNQYRRDGTQRRIPNLAFAARHYNLDFSRRPTQELWSSDPVYNDRRFWLGQFIVFKQSFYRTRRFFGFGRTEDIPSGYNASISAGTERWLGRKRNYTGLEGEKFWRLRRDALLRTNIGLGTFWRNSKAEDAVIHLAAEHFSGFMERKWGGLRQFSFVDFLASPRHHFYKPLNINREQGIWGYKNFRETGYQRLNVRTETIYYSPLKVYGFKFSFYQSLQLTLLSESDESIFDSPVYSGIGLGCRIRNENLSLNTLRLSVNYYPAAPEGVKPLLFEVTTIADIRFDLSAIKSPAFVRFY